MSIKSSKKSSEISVGKLHRAYKTKDLFNLSVRAREILMNKLHCRCIKYHDR